MCTTHRHGCRLYAATPTLASYCHRGLLLPVHVAVLLARLQASRRSDDPIAPLRAVLQEREREMGWRDAREQRSYAGNMDAKYNRKLQCNSYNRIYILYIVPSLKQATK